MYLEIKLDELITVKESPVHGKGLFAKIDIPEDKTVMLIEGEIIDENECVRREEEENNVYIFWNGDHYIDSTNEVIMYINHDCEPNCIVDEIEGNRLGIYAVRPIQAGEEITIDYGYDEIYDGCNCLTCKTGLAKSA